MSVALAAGAKEDAVAYSAGPLLDAVDLVDVVIDEIPLPTGGFILSSRGGGGDKQIGTGRRAILIELER